MLQSGDRLKQPEFHRRYLEMPAGQKFELVEGRVFMPSPVSGPHGIFDNLLGALLVFYRSQTPGTQDMGNGTIILDQVNEEQPDQCLWILPAFGGQTRLKNRKYVMGAPEWVGEIAYSSVAIDLYEKQTAYERNGVHEYLVYCVPDRTFHVFDFKAKSQITPDARGILRSRAMPGLWIDTAAFRSNKAARALKTLQAGLDSQEHAEFVARLASAKKRRKTSGGRSIDRR